MNLVFQAIHFGHNGLTAGVFDELGISDMIDALLLKKRSGHNISHSTVVLKAMFLNVLGFTEHRPWFSKIHFGHTLKPMH
ncbi:Mobile element protein [Methanosarcina barkeri str. Wiesmoor]|uniref:Mobile element protein n=1 Tax=Methanosarcina barkeri str. Wiesmoor TaxID=1434109 RepID=A0A0E3QIX3_METBA|nr:Mobile element protein [Methanosarcina barkeri str. Wiesmoor]